MVRLDRLLTVTFFSLYRTVVPLKNKTIPILMYHSISHSDKQYSHPYFEVNTPADVFQRQIEFLKNNDYSTIDLNAFCQKSVDYFTNNRIVITFDDGFRDFYTTAFPILKEYGFTATVFIPTQFIDKRSPGIIDKEHLSWQEIKSCVRQGIQFGSHTVSHCLLVNESFPTIQVELRESKNEIENRLGLPVPFFSYPYAFPEHDKQFVAQLRLLLLETGYHCGVTTKIGVAKVGDDPFFLKRIPVNSFDDQQLFKAKLQGAYDWLAMVQYLKKMAWLLHKKKNYYE